jgi:hypothetical protein
MTEEMRNKVVKALNELTSITGILFVMVKADTSDVSGLSGCDVEWLAQQADRIITDTHALVSRR